MRAPNGLVWLAVLALTPAPAFAIGPEPDGGVVEAWNDLALQTVRDGRLTDSQSARLYAMVNVAMYDAVNGSLSRPGERRTAALVHPERVPRAADPEAAAAAAAHAVLVSLDPGRAPIFDAQLAQELAALGHRPGVKAGTEWGAQVGSAVLAARANDGSSPEETQPAGSGPGVFRASWGGVQFRNLAPFAIADPSVYVSPGPPALDTLDYAAALEEVRVLGNAALPDDAKLATFQFWSLGAGTAQPTGAWIQIALTAAAGAGLRLPDAARLLALVSMAMSDVVAPTVQTKFQFRRWRPATAIREADTDGNPVTAPDPAWAPRGGGIGANPEHWSGHSAFSGAAATVLRGFFCRDALPFELTTDSAPGGAARAYPSFSAAEAEAGRSRVMGGVHFEFSNQAGLAAGRGVGAEVLRRSLLLERGPTHVGECPR